MAERIIQIVKKALKKASASKEDPVLALLSLSTTPMSCDSMSLATKCMGRDICTTLPKVRTTRHLADAQKIEYPTNYYNRQYTNLPELHLGDTVRFRQKPYPRKLWDTKGSVVAKVQESRSHKIETETGQVYRCNCRDILKTDETFNKDSQVPHSAVEISSDDTPSVKESSDTNVKENYDKSAPHVSRPPPEESMQSHYTSHHERLIKPPQTMGLNSKRYIEFF